MMSPKSAKGLFFSFLIGGAIGCTVALLYAPKSGKKLRKDIGKKTGELIKDGKKLTSNSWNEAKEFTESTFENINDLLNSGVEKIVNKTEKVKDAFRTVVDA